MRIPPIRLFRKQSHEGGENDLFNLCLFHIERDGGWDRLCTVEQWSKARRKGVIGAFRIDGIELRIERRQFDRQMDTRNAPEMIGFQEIVGRPHGGLSIK